MEMAEEDILIWGGLWLLESQDVLFPNKLFSGPC